jgi:outer membrane protein OmpA-like peptidoglycan-associated protein
MFRACISAGLFAIALAGCGSPVVFQGESTLKIAGQPPPPPPVAEPAPEPARVELQDNKIVINEKVQFEYDKATILEVSFSLLNEVAAVIKKHPHLKKIQVEGHASSDGEARHNQRLSEERARSVMRYLVDKGGVPKGHLVAKGFGIDRPIADNGTQEGRERNRRVEFNVLEQDVTQRKVEIDKSGKEKVIEEKVIKSSDGTPTTPTTSSK